MNVSLNKYWEKFIEDKVLSGRYHSSSEVVREALRLLEERDEEYQKSVIELRREIEKGRQGSPIAFNGENIKKNARKKLKEKTH